MNKSSEIYRILPIEIENAIREINVDLQHIQEIRIRIHCPLIVLCSNREIVIDRIIIDRRLIDKTMESVSGYSLYTFEEEIRQGFITVQGGHRAGISGQIILEHGNIKNIKNISFINIRVAHEIVGCADSIMRYIYNDGRVFHTLIISPPGCGKTTLLRDIIRQLSNAGKNVSVIDERSEIAGCYQGIPENDVGIRTDVFDCCPKDIGMLMAIRSMAPEVVAIDEIGKQSDIEAIKYIINCGCAVIGTVHGVSYEDIKSKPVLREMINDNVFKRYIILSGGKGVGTIAEII